MRGRMGAFMFAIAQHAAATKKPLPRKSFVAAGALASAGVRFAAAPVARTPRTRGPPGARGHREGAGLKATQLRAARAAQRCTTAE